MFSSEKCNQVVFSVAGVGVLEVLCGHLEQEWTDYISQTRKLWARVSGSSTSLNLGSRVGEGSATLQTLLSRSFPVDLEFETEMPAYEFIK